MNLPHLFINPAELMRYNGYCHCPNCGNPLKAVWKAQAQITDQHYNILFVSLYICEQNCEKPITLRFWQPEAGRMVEGPETTGWMALKNMAGFLPELSEFTDSVNNTF